MTTTPFNDVLAQNGFAQILLLHGESVTYTFADATTATRTAIVDRSPHEILDGTEIVIPTAMLRFHNDSTTGISANNIDTGGDKITFTLQVNDASTVTRYVTHLVSNDGGVTKVAVK